MKISYHFVAALFVILCLRTSAGLAQGTYVDSSSGADSAPEPEPQAVSVKLDGFGDAIFGNIFGKPADQNAANLFNKYGDENYPTGMHNGFVLHGVDFLNTV